MLLQMCFRYLTTAGLKLAFGFHSTQALQLHCYGFIYTVSLLDLMQTGYWVYCELLVKKGNTKCVFVYTSICVHTS